MRHPENFLMSTKFTLQFQRKSAIIGFVVMMQGWYIGITAASQAVKAGSTPVPCSNKPSFG